MSEIKVSVIMPVYNAETYLEEAIECLICQTLKEIEIICVDDGSTDRSLEILEEYSKRDDEICRLLSTGDPKGMDLLFNTYYSRLVVWADTFLKDIQLENLLYSLIRTICLKEDYWKKHINKGKK